MRAPKRAPEPAMSYPVGGADTPGAKGDPAHFFQRRPPGETGRGLHLTFPIAFKRLASSLPNISLMLGAPLRPAGPLSNAMAVAARLRRPGNLSSGSVALGATANALRSLLSWSANRAASSGKTLPTLDGPDDAAGRTVPRKAEVSRAALDRGNDPVGHNADGCQSVVPSWFSLLGAGCSCCCNPARPCAREGAAHP